MNDFDDSKESIITVPDYPVGGVQFRDVTTLIQNPKHFKKNDRWYDSTMGKRKH